MPLFLLTRLTLPLKERERTIIFFQSLKSFKAEHFQLKSCFNHIFTAFSKLVDPWCQAPPDTSLEYLDMTDNGHKVPYHGPFLGPF